MGIEICTLSLKPPHTLTKLSRYSFEYLRRDVGVQVKLAQSMPYREVLQHLVYNPAQRLFHKTFNARDDALYEDLSERIRYYIQTTHLKDILVVACGHLF